MVKKLLTLISIATIILGFNGLAAAADPCSIYDTGTNSNNTCETNLTNHLYATCDNNIIVDNNNSQIGSTGQVLIDNNTTSGSGSTGSTNNSNVVVTNIGASCTNQVATTTPSVASTTPATPSPTSATVTPVKTPEAQVKSLPKTGNNTLVKTSAITIVSLGSAMAISQLGILAYRRFAIN